MVDSFDFSTLDFSADFGEEDELSQLSTCQTDNETQLTQLSTDLDTLDHYEINLSSQLSQQSTVSVDNQCKNCGAVNTLQLDDNTGVKICTNCSHIVQVKYIMCARIYQLDLKQNINT